MTQQYIVGQFSVLLADLRPVRGEWLAAVDELRQEVELSPLSELPRLAREALSLMDAICWAALEQGAASDFRRYAAAAVELRDFTANAGLLP